MRCCSVAEGGKRTTRCAESGPASRRATVASKVGLCVRAPSPCSSSIASPISVVARISSACGSITAWGGERTGLNRVTGVGGPGETTAARRPPETLFVGFASKQIAHQAAGKQHAPVALLEQHVPQGGCGLVA